VCLQVRDRVFDAAAPSQRVSRSNVQVLKAAGLTTSKVANVVIVKNREPKKNNSFVRVASIALLGARVAIMPVPGVGFLMRDFGCCASADVCRCD
jgi:hypothetical protein